MSLRDRRLFRALARAHGLNRREERICRRVAAFHGLDGVQTSPAAVFFRPSDWRGCLRGKLRGLRRPRPPELEALAAKLFATPADELPLAW